MNQKSTIYKVKQFIHIEQLGPVKQEAFHEWGYPGTTPLRLFTASTHSTFDILQLNCRTSTFILFKTRERAELQTVM